MDQIGKNFKEKLKAGSDALFWIRLANDSYFSLRNLFLTLATLLLPITASVIGVKEIRSELGILDKALLILGWISLFISIGFGVKQHFIDSDYFANFSRINSWKEHIYKIFEDFPNVAKKQPKLIDRIVGSIPSPKEKSHDWALRAQIVFIIGGIILVMVLAFRILVRN